MYVTTYNNRDGANGTFIRLNESLSGAQEQAFADARESLTEVYANTTTNSTHSIECIDAEGDDPTIIRIINPTNGHEYEAYIIEEYIPGN